MYYKKIRVLCCFLMVSLILGMVSGCNKKKDNASVAPDASEMSQPPVSGPLILQNELELTGDNITASVYGNTLKLEYITPGLDTTVIDTVLYSMTDNTVLGQTTLSENQWYTGSLENGFYAISLTDCEIIFYDNACKEISRKKPENSGSLWAFAAISPDSRYLLYGNAVTADICLYSLADDTQKKVGGFSGYIDTAGYEDGCFFLKNSSGELLKVDPEIDYIEAVYADNRLNFITPYYGIGTTETNFIIVPSEKADTPVFTAFQSVDEIPIASSASGFVTCASLVEKNILRIYNMNEFRFIEMEVPGTVYQVIYTDDGGLVILSKNNSGQFEVYFENPASLTARDIVISESDTIIPPDDTTPSQNESTDQESDSSSAGKRIEGVPVIGQMPGYPTGCESVSTVMALQFVGENVSVDAFIDNYLKMSSDFYYADGVRYGPDPYETFIGSPRAKSAFGCMAPVIVDALTAYFTSDQVVFNTTGTTMEALCSEYIDKDIPVIIWVSILMKEPYYSSTWHLANGEKYSWLANEHCMLLVGYDDDYYYYNDPYTGKMVKYGKAISEKRYEQFGRQSVVIVK